jgi:hypothetical protein
MKLRDLSFACYVYAGMSDYDSSYNRLRSETLPQIDLSLHKHQISLLRWLNDWGCRQFSKDHHALAANEISSWYNRFSPRFFAPQKMLHSLSDDELNFVQETFGDLMHRTASMRKTRNKQTSRIEIGPTGAAKILFALRPNAMVPWDIQIRSNHGLDGSARSYRSFLITVREHLTELNIECEKYGMNFEELPVLLGRPGSSLVKLVDEFFWVTITRKCMPPSENLLGQWIEWR